MFEQCEVPVENLVGEENKGWEYAKFLLTYERTGIAGVGLAVAAFERLVEIARAEQKNGRPLIEDPSFAQRMAKVEIDLANMKTTNLRVLESATRGGVPGAESSMLKVRGTEIRQEISSLTRRALGPYAQPYVSALLDHGSDAAAVGPDYSAAVTSQYLNLRKLSIYGGSNEVQRSIIAKSMVGL